MCRCWGRRGRGWPRWYILGLDEGRGEERALKLNRLQRVEPTDRPYMVPDGWTVEKYLGAAWRMIRGDKRYHVRVRFQREYGKTMSETLWHASQRVTWEAGGCCLFECEADAPGRGRLVGAGLRAERGGPGAAGAP